MSGDGVPLIQMDKDDREYPKEELELHTDLGHILDQLLSVAQRLIDNEKGEPVESETDLEAGDPAEAACPTPNAGPRPMPKQVQRIFRQVAAAQDLCVPRLRGALTPDALTYEDTSVRVARRQHEMDAEMAMSWLHPKCFGSEESR